MFEKSRGVQTDERESHAKSIHQCLEDAVFEGILQGDEIAAQPNRYVSPDHPYAPYNVTYKFANPIWRSNILKVTMKEWKRDMHSRIAQTMESAMERQMQNDYRMLAKLFGHWKSAGSAKKAASLALKMGRNLEDIGLTHHSLVVYRESLDMWRDMDINNTSDEAAGGESFHLVGSQNLLDCLCRTPRTHSSDRISLATMMTHLTFIPFLNTHLRTRTGLSQQLLGELKSSDVGHLIRLNVALGRCYTNVLNQKESVKAYQTALNVSQIQLCPFCFVRSFLCM